MIEQITEMGKKNLLCVCCIDWSSWMVMKDESEMFSKHHCSLCLDICQSTGLGGLWKMSSHTFCFLCPITPATWQVILFIPFILSFCKPFWLSEEQIIYPNLPHPLKVFFFLPHTGDMTLKYSKLFYYTKLEA